VFIEELAVGVAGVLAAAIGMVDEPIVGLSRFKGHRQGGQDQLRSHVVADRPSHDAARERSMTTAR